MKLQKENMNKEEEFESIARTLGIDIDEILSPWQQQPLRAGVRSGQRRRG